MTTTPKKKRSPLVAVFVLAGLAGACVPCVGIVAAVGVPSFVSYVRRSKTAEAPANVRAIAQGVIAVWETTGALPPALPSTPGAPSSERRMWPGDAAPGWAEIGFAPVDPLYYSYEYEPDPSGTSFVVRARGDLDGDGVQSMFEQEFARDPVTQEMTHSGLYVIDELE